MYPRENGGGICEKPKSKMATVGHIGNVTWKLIDIESCVIPLFLLILAWRIHFWHRFCILTSPTINIQDGCLLYWKNLTVNGHRNPCNIIFPTKCGSGSPFLASFLYFDESKYQNSRWPPSRDSIFFCLEPYNPYYLLNFTRETRFQQYVLISGYHLLYFDKPKHLNSRWHRPHFIMRVITYSCWDKSAYKSVVKGVHRWQFCARHDSWAALSCRDMRKIVTWLLETESGEKYFHKTDSSSWWRHQMETFSALLALCEENPSVTGEFPAQRPVTQNFDVFFDLRLKKRLSKQSRRRWFETPPCSLRRHCYLHGNHATVIWAPDPSYQCGDMLFYPTMTRRNNTGNFGHNLTFNLNLSNIAWSHLTATYGHYCIW